MLVVLPLACVPRSCHQSNFTFFGSFAPFVFFHESFSLVGLVEQTTDFGVMVKQMKNILSCIHCDKHLNAFRVAS